MVSAISFQMFFVLPHIILGWGDTGHQETSTDKLQATLVPIIRSSNCAERMNLADPLDENLIVCAGGTGSGPCKVI